MTKSAEMTKADKIGYSDKMVTDKKRLTKCRQLCHENTEMRPRRRRRSARGVEGGDHHDMAMKSDSPEIKSVIFALLLYDLFFRI